MVVLFIVVSVFAIWSLSKYGPPAVDNYFLPTIEYVSGTFHAIALQPAPVTASSHTYTPMAAGPTFTIPQTVFVQQTGYETRSMLERATIVVMKYGQRLFTDPFTKHDEPSPRVLFLSRKVFSCHPENHSDSPLSPIPVIG